jgi:predicted PurR-regulated permease PerM
MTTDPKPDAKPYPIALYVILGAALFAFIQTFWMLSPILLSFMLILLIALALNPVVSWVRGLTGGRAGAAVLVAAIVVAVVALTAWVSVGPVKTSYNRLSKEFPHYWERLQRPLIRMEQKAENFEDKLQKEVEVEIARDAAEEGKPHAPRAAAPAAPAEPTTTEVSLRSRLNKMFEGAVGRFAHVAFNGAQVLIVLVTVFFGVTFTLMNPRPLIGAMFSLLPERHHPQALVIAQRIGKFVPGWAAATLIGMATIGTLVFLLTWPILGFKDALVLGLIAGLLEAIPFIGPMLSAIPALLLAFGEGGMTPVVGCARLRRGPASGEQRDSPVRHGPQHEGAPRGRDVLDAAVRGRVRGAGCPDRGSGRRHR